WGLGATFLSGATQAWIADEVGQGNAGSAFMRGAQVQQFLTLLAVPVSVALASITLNAPILAGGALMLGLGASLAVFMPERNFHRSESKHRESMLHTLRQGARVVRGSQLLITILLLAAFFGMASEGFDRLWTPHILDNFTL